MTALTPITNPNLVPEYILGLRTVNEDSTPVRLITSTASAFLIAPGVALSAAHNFTALEDGLPDLDSFTVNPRTTNILTSSPFGIHAGTHTLFTDYNPQNPFNGEDLGDDIALVDFSGNTGGATAARLVVFQRGFDAFEFTNSVQLYGYDVNGQLLTGIGDVEAVDASSEGDTELIISGIDAVPGNSGGAYEFDIALPYLNNISVTGIGGVHVAGEGETVDAVANPFSIQDYNSIVLQLFARGIDANDVESPQIILNSQSPNPAESSFIGTYLNETVYGTNASQTINGGNGSDLVYGSTGNDVLLGGSEAFTIDQLSYSTLSPGASIRATISGIDNVDILKVSLSGLTFFDLALNLLGFDSVGGFEFIFGSEGDDTFTLSDIDADMTIFGEGGSDTLILGSGLEGAVHNSFANTITLNGFTVEYVGFENVIDNISSPFPFPSPFPFLPDTDINSNDNIAGLTSSVVFDDFGGNDLALKSNSFQELLAGTFGFNEYSDVYDYSEATEIFDQNSYEDLIAFF